jgi:hypothetical protein
MHRRHATRFIEASRRHVFYVLATMVLGTLCLISEATAQPAGCSLPTAYPGDDAARSVLAAWMAARATSRGIPGELPVMAALARSGLSNRALDPAGRAGYFGMLDHVWHSGPYAGFQDDADVQLEWFINQMIAIRDRAMLLGARQFGERESQWGVWIELALLVGRASSYAPRLAEARALIAAGCSQPPPITCTYRAIYPGDDAAQADIASWMAGRAVQANIPPELPLIAALADSGLRNVDFGDGDSVGFFQMRTSIWNQGAYAGFPEDPDLQMTWFLDQAAAVRAARIAAGDPAFGHDPLSWGEWAAAVQRPAEPFRGRYQLRLADARRLLDLACGR